MSNFDEKELVVKYLIWLVLGLIACSDSAIGFIILLLNRGSV